MPYENLENEEIYPNHGVRGRALEWMINVIIFVDLHNKNSIDIWRNATNYEDKRNMC